MSSAVDILSQGGFQNADAIVRAANDTGLPLGIAVALIAKESMGANVYGHDAGGAMSGAGAVTEDNFKNQFLPLVMAGHTSNGVGPTQITYPGYFTQNPNLAWWDPYTNMCFGFNLMKGYLNGNYSDSALIAAGSMYNSGTTTGSASTYGKTFDQLATTWTDKLKNADTNTSTPDIASAESVNTTTGVFMALTDDQQQQMFDRVMGGIPNGAARQDGSKLLDSADGAYIVSLIKIITDRINYASGDDKKPYAIACQGDVNIILDRISSEIAKVIAAIPTVASGGLSIDQLATVVKGAISGATITAK